MIKKLSFSREEVNKLTKLGRCDRYTIEWLNNRTARLLGLLGHEMAIFPVLQKLTHMSSESSYSTENEDKKRMNKGNVDGNCQTESQSLTCKEVQTLSKRTLVPVFHTCMIC